MARKVLLALAVLAVTAGVAGVAVSRTTPPPGAGDRLAESLLSPGPLHDQHRDVACTGCHRPFRGVRSELCATGDCHPRSRLDEAKPAVVAVHRKNEDLSCLACHTDHRGRTASLTTLAFHRQATRDSQRDCVACHQAEAGRAHPQIKLQDCAKCHTTTAWRPARFDHADLAAADRQRCADCHLDAGRRAHPGIRSTDCAACHTSTARWSEVSFSHRQVAGEPCTSCHRPPRGWLHEAARDTQCTACHTTRSWGQIIFRHPRVPGLNEEHGCRDCHPTSLQRVRPCEACHRGGFFED